MRLMSLPRCSIASCPSLLKFTATLTAINCSERRQCLVWRMVKRSSPLRMRALAALVTLLAIVVGVLLLTQPGVEERSAIGQRAALHEAQAAFARGEIDNAIAVLESAPMGEDTVEMLLRLYENQDRGDAHASLLRRVSRLNQRDLRQAAAFYSRIGRQRDLEFALDALQRANVTTPEEMFRLAQLRAAREPNLSQTALARSAADALSPGEAAPAAAFVVSEFARVGLHDEARLFAARWMARDASNEELAIIAPALQRAGLDDEILAVLRERQQRDGAAWGAYITTLRAAAAAAPAHRSEYTLALLDRLPSLTGADHAAALHDLFNYGDPSLAAREIGRRGLMRIPAVNQGAIYWLARLGRNEALVQLVRADAAHSLNAEETRAAARTLASAGDVDGAIAVLKASVAQAGPESGAAQDLFYVWRAHNRAPDVAWLSEQARAASNPGAWVLAVQRGGSAEAAKAMLDALLTSRTTDAALWLIRSRFLAWDGDSPQLRLALQRAVAYAAPADVRELSQIACAVGDVDALAALHPRVTGADQQRLAVCTARAQLAAARRQAGDGGLHAALEAFAAADRLAALQGAQDRLDYAFALERTGRANEALGQFQAALVALDSEPGRARLSLRAQILTKLGRLDEAEAVLRTALAADPADRRARRLLAELYVEQRRYGDALAISAAPAATAPVSETPVADSELPPRDHAEI